VAAEEEELLLVVVVLVVVEAGEPSTVAEDSDHAGELRVAVAAAGALEGPASFLSCARVGGRRDPTEWASRQ
jgi:hypothetical protein